MNPINTYIDHTLLKPQATPEQIRKLCAEAREYAFASVCVNSCYANLVAEELRDSGVKTCCVIGFPLGAMSTAAKAAETALTVADGAEEIDMVINVGAAKAGDWAYVEKDIAAVVEAAHAGRAAAEGRPASGAPASGMSAGGCEGMMNGELNAPVGSCEGMMNGELNASASGHEGMTSGELNAPVGSREAPAAPRAIVKVILENCLLTEAEIVEACLAAKRAGAEFVKTSTGFSTGGARVEDGRLMCETVGPDMGVKAAGGIRDFVTAKAMIEAGATRIGASAGLAIVREAAG